MRKKTIMKISAILLSLISALTGCGRRPFNEPVSGGVTDRTDYKAPKEIKSKEITEYYAHFLLEGEWSEGNPDRFYTFEIKKDENGTLLVTEELTGVSEPADEDLLKGLQDVIDEYRLAGNNGEYRTTAGLPPEFMPCTLRVDYASGEKLTFTHNNDPDAPWAGATYLLFAEWFAGKGENVLYPKDPEYGPLIGISMRLGDYKGKSFYYFANRDDDPPELVRLANGGHQELLIPEGFFEHIEETVKHYDLRPYDLRSPVSYLYKPYDPAKSFEGQLQFTLFFEDGDQFHVNADLESTIEYFLPLLTDLSEYFDSLFEAELPQK